MPCELQGWEVAHEESRIRKGLKDKHRREKRTLATIACEAIRLLEKRKTMKDASPLLKTWWKRHKPRDRRRRK